MFHLQAGTMLPAESASAEQQNEEQHHPRSQNQAVQQMGIRKTVDLVDEHADGQGVSHTILKAVNEL